MWMTWFMTWLDMTVLVHSCHYWCACQDAVLLGEGCPHGVSQLHLHMEKCKKSSIVIGLLDVPFARSSLLVCWKAWQVRLFTKGACSFIHPFVSASCMFSHLPVCEKLFAWPFVREHISLHHRLLVNMSFCMCYPSFIPFSWHHVCLYTCSYIHSCWDEIKSKKILVYHDTWSFGMQVTGRGEKVARWDGGSGTADENYETITGWWRCSIRIDNDCLRGLAQLEEKSV